MINGILYYRVPAVRWQDTNHSKAISNVNSFLSTRYREVIRCTLVSASNSYSVVCIELEDRHDQGLFQQELIIEFDTKPTALAWLAEQHLQDCLCDHQL